MAGRDDVTPPPLFWPKGSPAASLAADRSWMQAAMGLAVRYAGFAGQSSDLPALQQEACRVAAEGLAADCSALLVYDVKDEAFHAVAGTGLPPSPDGCPRWAADIDAAASFAWHVEKPVVSNAPELYPSFRPPGCPDGDRAPQSIYVPVCADDGTAHSVLAAGRPSDQAFATLDVHFLQLLAHSLAAAQTRLSAQAFHDEQAGCRARVYHASLHEMQHRMRNDLQGICSSIARESRGLDDGAQRAGYDRVSRQVQALAALYDHLLIMSADSAVEFGAYLDLLCVRIAAAGDLGSRGIALTAKTKPLNLPIDRAGRLAIAINELIANAVAHAFPDGRPGEIMVRLVDDGGGPVVTVSDNGLGFQGHRQEGNGLRFVDRLVRGAGGVLTRLDAAGLEWRIALSV